MKQCWDRFIWKIGVIFEKEEGWYDLIVASSHVGGLDGRGSREKGGMAVGRVERWGRRRVPHG